MKCLEYLLFLLAPPSLLSFLLPTSLTRDTQFAPCCVILCSLLSNCLDNELLQCLLFWYPQLHRELWGQENCSSSLCQSMQPSKKYYIKSFLPPLPYAIMNSLFLEWISSTHNATSLYIYTLPFPEMLSFLVVNFHYLKNYFVSWEIIIYPSGYSLENFFLHVSTHQTLFYG